MKAEEGESKVQTSTKTEFRNGKWIVTTTTTTTKQVNGSK
jgi:hypothetical protein